MRLTIGLFTDTYQPQVNGVATSTATLKKNLERLGHTVYVFTVSNEKAPIDEKGIFRIPSMEAMAGHHIASPYNIRLARAIKQLDLDVIHTHTEFSVGLFAKFIARRLRLPIIHTYHTIYEDYTHYIIKSKKFGYASKEIARRMSRIFCNTSDYVVVPTAKVAKLLRFYGVTKPISVVPTGINLNKFRADYLEADEITKKRQELGLDANHKIILYLGRVAAEKNISETLSHLQDFLMSHDDARFVIVGDGPDRENLETLVGNLKIENKVIFTGEIPWAKVPAYYKMSHVFVTASQSETQGITFIESLAIGLPVLAKEDEVLLDVVEPGVNGYLFNCKETFTKHLEAILYRPNHQEELSKNAATNVERFSEENFGRNMEKVYLRAIASHD